MEAVLVLRHYRRCCLGNVLKERSTFLSNVDQLAAIQLAIILLEKKNSLLPKSATLTDVTRIHRYISHHKLEGVQAHQAQPSASSPSTPKFPLLHNAEDIFPCYSDFITSCNMIDAQDIGKYVVELFQGQGLTYDLQTPSTPKIGCPIWSFFGITFDKEVWHQIPNINICEGVNYGQSVPSNYSSAHIQLHRVVMSYLKLLVNSRDEMALARAIDVPARGINHAAFTKIRKVASEKKMPMFQVVSSFVRCINLGGAGYQPKQGNALLRHVEGLKDFMELIDKMQSCVEDACDVTSMFLGTLKLIKLALIKAKTPTFTSKVIQEVFQQVDDEVKWYLSVLAAEKDVVYAEGMQMVFAVRDFLDFISCVSEIDVHAISRSVNSPLCGVLSTPVDNAGCLRRMPSLSTQFRTPDNLADDETPKKAKLSKIANRHGPRRGGRPLTYIDAALEDRPVTTVQFFGERNAEHARFECSPEFRLIRCSTEGTISVGASKNKHVGECVAGTGRTASLIAPRRLPIAAKENSPVGHVGKKSVKTCIDTQNMKKKANGTNANGKRKSRSDRSKQVSLLPGQKRLSQYFTS